MKTLGLRQAYWPVSGYYSWYLSMLGKDTASQEELQKYDASPIEGYEGYFFPEEYFESLIQKYFDVSAEYLRSDSEIYSAEYKGYYLEGHGGPEEGPEIILDRVEKGGRAASSPFPSFL